MNFVLKSCFYWSVLLLIFFYRKGGLNGDIINPIQSARLRTINSFSFTYGTVEIRAKMSRGDWIWPCINLLLITEANEMLSLFRLFWYRIALWLLPTDYAYGTWPASGEIDMVEIRGNEKYVCDGMTSGNQRANSTLHWGVSTTKDKYTTTRWTK